MPASSPASGNDLFARAQGRVSEVSRRAVEQVVRDVDFYSRLPVEIVEGELTHYMMTNVRLYLRLLREERLPTDEDIAEPVSAGIRRAQEGVPFAEMLSAYLYATRAALAELAEMAGPEEQDQLVRAGDHALRYLGVLLPKVAGVYFDEHRALYGEDQELRRALTAALLTGRPVAELAARARVSLDDSYAVFALDLAPSGPEDVLPGVTTEIAERRTLRNLQQILGRHLGDRGFSDLGPRGGVVLVPTSELDGDVAAPAAGVLAEITGLLGCPAYAALALDRKRDEIPDAVEETSRVARLARLLGRPPGVFALDDVLTEYQLTRPGPARDRLAARVAPLAGHEHLRESLRAFVAHDSNVKAAAQELHVHANTLHYRLRRVGELTGLDPTSAGDLRTLVAALVADLVTSG